MLPPVIIKINGDDLPLGGVHKRIVKGSTPTSPIKHYDIIRTHSIKAGGRGEEVGEFKL